MKALHIVGWESYEHPDTKRSNANMPWVKTPTDHNGLSFIEIISHESGAAHFGVWNLLLQLAANGTPRGWLITNSGRIMGAKEIALKTRAKEPIVAEALSRLIAVGWLEELESASKSQAGRKQHASTQERTGEDSTGEDSTGEGEDRRDAQADCVGPEFMTTTGVWRMPLSVRASLVAGFPHLDIDGQCAKAAAWTHSSTKRKTVRGMPKFLFNWMNRDRGDRPGNDPAPEALSPEQIAIGLEASRLHREGKL